ncbi:NMDA receptor synaptonuclear signaling and neuronal migration factor isoform X5 [Thalassophryne amazonica]|uniref:NMDA receptor synaptonuclear signaling and neuronal migration factor isoform X5 n=1 Tax=Thalassophryne amazonica TaxID=390379 RepID=UPI00147156A1|nr:NMDA receptor synaptonuclear signaling and neuronal migration factor isoform X5 [Thalassophryne amazonica]
MGTAASKRKNLRNDAISSVAAKVRAARAFGEYLSHTHPENRNGSAHLLCETLVGPDPEGPTDTVGSNSNHLLHSRTNTNTGSVAKSNPSLLKPPFKLLPPPAPSVAVSTKPAQLTLERSFSVEEDQQKCVECTLQPARVYTITTQHEDTNWFPKENMFTFQTATTTMQAISNFRKHLRMVGSRRIKAQTFAERRSKSFSRSWSDPTPVKTDSPNEPRESGDVQNASSTQDEASLDDTIDWEEEREIERLACEGDDFVPPKIMLISSKVPKAEYIPNIIRRDDPSIIPILYDHEHATFDDILEEIDKKLTAYRRGSKFWRMLIFCQGGPGHLYLLKNKVATFAKVEKEEDMSQFWRRLSRFMSKVNPEPNIIHIMGCYVLGNPNGEKLFEKLKNLMRPYSVEFESPLELSAQGKEMIEMYFDFRLYRLWKTRQHSKLLDYEDFL